MKLLKIFGIVAAVHLFAFIAIFLSPGCQSSPRNVPTPDATMPAATVPSEPPVAYNAAPLPAADLGTPGRAAPTRPGSPNAAAITPAKSVAEDIAPVSAYTVQKGDSLWSIAKKNHLTVAELAKANNVSASTALQPGKKLIVPGKVAAPKDLSTAAVPETKPAATPARVSGESVRHTIQPGEKLAAIARKYQVSLGELAAANNISDPAKIRPGQTLVIPGARSAATKPSSKPASTTKAPAAATPAAPTETVATPAKDATPHFEIKAPPPGQDLDAGLNDTSTTTEVPTIKVEETTKSEDPKKD